MAVGLMVFITGALVVMAGVALLNAVTFPRIRSPHPPTGSPLRSDFGAAPFRPLPVERGRRTSADAEAMYGLPTSGDFVHLEADGMNAVPTESRSLGGGDFVHVEGKTRISVLIPARNEAGVIGETVRRLLAQDVPNVEIVLLDDNSDDGTAEIARAAANGDTRLRIVQGAPLPPGWMGKNWACHQLAGQANGDWLVFTDADVLWQPGSLAALADEMARSGADLMTVWPTQITETWGERLVVPLMSMVIMAYLPAVLVNYTHWGAFAAANGQCLMFRRAAYDAVGGHAVVRQVIVEDIALARKVKGRGLRLWMADGAGLIACRMYRNWVQVRDGYAKNIIAGYGDSVIALLVASVFHWLVFFIPWLMLPVMPVWALALVLLGIGIRAFTAAMTRQRAADGVWMPVSVLLMTRIAIQALWWRWRYGGPRWKGRTIHTSKARVVEG